MGSGELQSECGDSARGCQALIVRKTLETLNWLHSLNPKNYKHETIREQEDRIACNVDDRIARLAELTKGIQRIGPM